jgi:adenine-specific DNA-methyltransferase
LATPAPTTPAQIPLLAASEPAAVPGSQWKQPMKTEHPASASTQLDGRSLNISEQRQQALKQLFPGVFTETRNHNGELVQTIDFERLKAELGTFSDVYDNRRERYGMEWPGKRDCLKVIQQPSLAALKPCREESVDFDTSNNLFIEGDNLEVLKLLQKSYYGAVKMIYIDPPYNTGKEFIYPDNFSESLDTYLQYAGLKDSAGRKFTSANGDNQGRFHTNWLNMMYPRLYLARNLLREDGVIFISIDDNEVENLRRLCNEIFGEENFIATLIWQKVFSPKNSAKYISEDHDFILVYARNSEIWRPTLLPRTDEANDRFSNPDNDPRGLWSSSDLCARNYYGEGTYSVICPSGRIINSPPQGSYWRVSKTRFEEMNADNRIWWGEEGNNMPRQKRFLSEVKDGIVPQTLLLYKDVGHTQEAKKELLEFVDFDNTENVLNSVKPTRLLRHLLKIGTRPDNQDIVLDFFSGSASSGHAVMAQNQEDSGDRQFILVQLPEPLKTEEANAKFISDLGKSRLRNVSKKLKLNTQPLPDLGFKVFKLDRSNFKQWQAPSSDVHNADLLEQMELAIDPVQAEATPEQMLYELLLKLGVPLTAELSIIELAGQPLYSIEDSSLLIYLHTPITQPLLDAVLALAPGQFICLDKAFEGNDPLKANAVKTFAHFNAGQDSDVSRIDFKTV